MRRSSLLLTLLAAGVLIPRTAAAQTAVCRDGTYSYSQHRSGTCSHHGGVARWMDGGTAHRVDGKVKQNPRGSTTSPARRGTARHSTRGAPRPTRRSTHAAPRATRRPATRRSAASRGYYTGPRGGCYTYSASGRKRYVDRSFCR